MTKQILLNTRQAEERRLAIIEDGELAAFESEIAGQEDRTGNIYQGVVTDVTPGLEAAFVDFGDGKTGFLPLREVPRARPALKKGDEIIVQIQKDRRGDKGAALTALITLSGCFLVLLPGGGGRSRVSGRAAPGERRAAREQLSELRLPDEMSVIVRTAGIGRAVSEWQWDLDSYLLKLWRGIEEAARARRGAFLIFRENTLVLRAVRDYFKDDIDEIVCDAAAAFDEAREFMQASVPACADRVRLEEGAIFPAEIEAQIRRAFDRTVRLPSGGALVFDSTEALWAIDVNSASATGGANIEETALATNLEAAAEIPRQLRLRDLSGLIVVDFIDMESEDARAKVEKKFRANLMRDRARVRSTGISIFGMVEVSRQWLAAPLSKSHLVKCPRCGGGGRVKTAQSSALDALREIRAHARRKIAAVYARAPEDVATYLLNEKRIELRRIEDEYKCNVVVVPDVRLQTPDFRVRGARTGVKADMAAMRLPSFQARLKDAADSAPRPPAAARIETAAVDGFVPDRKKASPSGVSIFARIAAFLFGGGDGKKKAKPATARRRSQSGQGRTASAASRPSRQRGDSQPRGDAQQRGDGQQRTRARGGRRRGQPRRDGGDAPRQQTAQREGGRGDAAQRNGKSRRSPSAEKPPTPPMPADEKPAPLAVAEKPASSATAPIAAENKKKEPAPTATRQEEESQFTAPLAPPPEAPPSQTTHATPMQRFPAADAPASEGDNKPAADSKPADALSSPSSPPPSSSLNAAPDAPAAAKQTRFADGGDKDKKPAPEASSKPAPEAPSKTASDTPLAEGDFPTKAEAKPAPVAPPPPRKTVSDLRQVESPGEESSAGEKIPGDKSAGMESKSAVIELPSIASAPPPPSAAATKTLAQVETAPRSPA